MSHQTPHDDPFSSIPIADSHEPVTPVVDQKIPKLSDPQKPSYPRKVSRPKNTVSFFFKFAFLALLVCMVTYLAAGFFLLPYVVKNWGANSLAEKIDRPVTFGQVSFNPFTNKFEITNGIVGPRLSDPSDKIDPILSFNKMEIDIEAISLWHQALICKQFKFNQLYIHLVRQKDGSYNLHNILNNIEPNGSADINNSVKTKLIGIPFVKYSLNNIEITDSEILFTDLGSDSKHTVNDLTLNLPSYTNIPFTLKQESAANFSALVNGSHINLAGSSTDEATSQTNLNFKMADLEIAQYLNYLPLKDRVFIKKGKADLDLHLNITSKADQQFVLSGAVHLRDLEVEEKNGFASTYPDASIKGTFAPLTGKYHLTEISLTRPNLSINRTPDHGWMPPGLVDFFTNSNQLTTGNRIDRLQITNGNVTLIDQTLKKKLQLSFQDVNLSINLPASQKENLSSSGQPSKAQFAISANLDKALVNIQGNLDLSSKSTDGLLIANRINLNTFRPYFAKVSSLSIKKGFAEKISSRFRIGSNNNTPFIKLSEIDLDLSQISLSQQGETVISSKKISCKSGSFDSKKNRLNLGNISAQKSHLFSIRLQDKGKWLSLINSASAQKASSNKTTIVDINTISLSNSTLTIIDHNWPTPLSLSFSDFTFKTTSKANSNNQNFKASAVLDNTPINASGAFSTKPFSAQIHPRFTGLPITLFNPITDQYVSASLKGTVSAQDGTIHLPELTYKGSLSLSKFSCTKEKPIITWSNATAKSLSLSTDPFNLKIDDLFLQAPYLSLAENNNGEFFLSKTLTNSWHPSDNIKSTRLAINKATIDNGALLYHIPHAQNPFTMKITSLNGDINGYQLAIGSPLNLSLKGQIFEQSEVSFTASGEMYDENSILDFSIGLSPINLSVLAPHLEPYLGHKITGGTIGSQTNVQIGKSLLNAKTTLVLSETTLGNQIESKNIRAQGDSWKKVPLLIALKENNSGSFSIKIPASYNGPHNSISFWKTIRKNYRKLLLKATVSPFSIPSKDQEIPPLSDQISFAGGSTEITKKNQASLSALATMLQNRPRLQLIIAGFADAKLDRQALIDKKKSERKKIQLQQEAVISQAASATYGKEDMQQPKTNNNSKLERIPLRKITVSNASLYRLAQDRSQKCKDSLIALGVAPQQLYQTGKGEIINPSNLGRSGSRVIFSLKNL